MPRHKRAGRPATYGGFILTFEPGRSETLDVRLRYGKQEVTVTFSSKDWKLFPRELVVLSLFSADPGIDGVALMERTQVNAATAAWKLRIHAPVMFEKSISIKELSKPLRSTKLWSTPINLIRLSGEQWNNLLDRLKYLRPTQAYQLAAMEAARTTDRRIFPTNNRNTRLMEERDAVGLTVDIAGMDRRGILKGLDVSKLKEATSVLDLLDFEPFHEQDVIRHDQKIFGGLLRPRMKHALLKNSTGAEVRVHVYDKKTLETIVGIDLLIYQELFDAFILVQYKMMRRSSGTSDKWSYRVDKQMKSQLTAMKKVVAGSGVQGGNSYGITNWRLNDEVFYWKFCEATRIKDSEGTLVHGITLNREHLESFLSLPDSRSRAQVGQRIGYANCHRYLTNSQFVELAREGWIGGGAPMAKLIRRILVASQAGGRRTILAVIKSAEGIDKRDRGWRNNRR